jgi:hypothetical protein
MFFLYNTNSPKQESNSPENIYLLKTSNHLLVFPQFVRCAKMFGAIRFFPAENVSSIVEMERRDDDVRDEIALVHIGERAFLGKRNIPELQD